jgi:hypothetical protein
MATTTRPPSSYIAPERLYSLVGFMQCSGVAKSRIREARLRGLVLTVIKTGKRHFVRGADGIEFIEKLAELDAQARAAR